jgi:pimeloyl-ACP methyl ester carboxylesterase
VVSTAAESSSTVRKPCRSGMSSSGFGALYTSTPRRATLTRMRAQNFHPGAVRETTDSPSPIPDSLRAVRDDAGRYRGVWRDNCVVDDDGPVRITMDDGVELAVEVAGRGPGLLLVHGFGGAKEDFADHTAVLAERHTVVTADHRGHGESDAPSDPAAYSFDRLVADMVTVAERVGLDRFRLLGHSMGGMVARRIVLVHPERVEALILMDTAPGPIPNFDAELMDAAADVALMQGKAALKELLDLADPLGNPAYERVLAERPGYQEFQDRKWDALSQVMWAALVRSIAYQDDDLPAFATIACPTLVIVGEQDTPFLASSHAMAGAIPGARLEIIADAGHSPQFENPDVWLAAVREFLYALVPSAS